MGITRMSEFDEGQTKRPKRFGFQPPILYVGCKYGLLVQRDMKRFCPGIKLILIEDVTQALGTVIATPMNSIILDDGLSESEIIHFMESIRTDTTANTDTPVRLLALQDPVWAAKLVTRYDDFLAIPSDETSSPDDPFRLQL